jgi:hypothetical protein
MASTVTRSTALHGGDDQLFVREGTHSMRMPRRERQGEGDPTPIGRTGRDRVSAPARRSGGARAVRALRWWGSNQGAVQRTEQINPIADVRILSQVEVERASVSADREATERTTSPKGTNR